MRWRTLLATLAGGGLLIWLVFETGVVQVARAAVRLGPWGLAAILIFQLALVVIMAAAWALLGRVREAVPFRGFLWGRLARDAVSQALPFTQVGGVVVGSRALVLEGAKGDVAIASTISDLSTEFVSQIVFVALGGGLLAWLRPHSHLGRPILAVTAVLALMAGAMVAAQIWGAKWIEPAFRRLLGGMAGAGGAAPVAEASRAIARRPWRIVGACALHLAAWLLAAVQTWLTLRFLAVPVSLGGAVVLDSLTAGVKAVAFFVPASLGVQEGMLILVGAIFGVAPSAALALSLVRRARDLLIGVPTLGSWRLRHGARIWRAAPTPVTAPHAGGA